MLYKIKKTLLLNYLYTQVDYYQNETDGGDTLAKQQEDSSAADFKFIQLQKNELPFKIINFTWLNAKTLAVLGDTEKVHIIDIRSNEQLQVLNDLRTTQLVYNSTFFKSLATGGYVSKVL